MSLRYSRKCSTIAFLLVILISSGCGSPKKPELTPEQKAQREQQRIERNQQLKEQKIAEARNLGLLDMTAEEKADFMKSFVSRLRSKQVSICDRVSGIAYYSKHFYLVKCLNGTDFVANLSGDEIFGLKSHFAKLHFGVNPDLGVWFIDDSEESQDATHE